ncbi:unnamed protein product [Chilo suppressalis]|uniref:F-box domain-containing protein n=1 Tax=Chilo suppressalis TaxID=168631 RepID=A0ABN8B2W4_CHISP|nr:unnamed protein product [Chilo suppressalis]
MLPTLKYPMLLLPVFLSMKKNSFITNDSLQNEMSSEWASLPLLPLRCILDHLSTEDAVAAMSVCRHWRSSVLLYEGHKETLKLRAKQLDKCLFLTRMFRKYTNKLHIYLDCNDAELDKFMSYVLPQFFDTLKLYELIFIGPSHLLIEHPNLPVVKLKRIITESLIHKHAHSLQKLALLGCEMGVVKNENDRFIHKNVEYYSRPLSFAKVAVAADAILSRSNILVYSTLQHMIVDYEQINIDALETLSELSSFSRLTLNVRNKRQVTYSPIDWDRVDACYPNGLEVSVNIIAMPMKRMDELIDNVLREGMALTSLKVMYCKTLHQPLLEHIVRLYKETLRELVWADAPYDSYDPYNRIVRTGPPDEFGICNVNPFILLCWQCTQLRRLVIHGYWVWQYDLVGFARLRKSLASVEVSALYTRQGRWPPGAVRVLCADAAPHTAPHFVREMNEYTEFKWSPTPWSKLHPGLRARASPDHRSQYVLQEALQPLEVT